MKKRILFNPTQFNQKHADIDSFTRLSTNKVAAKIDF